MSLFLNKAFLLYTWLNISIRNKHQVNNHKHLSVTWRRGKISHLSSILPNIWPFLSRNKLKYISWWVMETKIFHFKSAKKLLTFREVLHIHAHICSLWSIHLATEGGLVTSFVLFIYQLLSVPKPPSIL